MKLNETQEDTEKEKIKKKVLKETKKLNKGRRKPGTMIIIGGHEDTSNHGSILMTIAKKIGNEKLVVFPFGSNYPEQVKEKYNAAFRKVGIKHLHFLDIKYRAEAHDPKTSEVLNDAAGVFIAGGDQHRINTLIGCTKLCERLRAIFANGGLIAGTSAGASVLSETMLVYPEHVNGNNGNEFEMAPGLGFLPRDILIDQHFSQRKRFGRLLSVVAKNPRLLGIGLDENTAIMMDRTSKFKVIGEGLAYIFDGSSITFMNLYETAYDLKVHILSEGYEFDLKHRKPIIPLDKLMNKNL
jgi:cyanophycinase